MPVLTEGMHTYDALHRRGAQSLARAWDHVVQVCDRIMPGYGEQMRAISLR